MKRQSEKVDYGESVRIRTELVNIARQRATVEGRTVKLVIENVLVKYFLPTPEAGGSAANKNFPKGKAR